MMKMTMSESIAACFSKFATFKGRASRSEYWWFILAVSLFQNLQSITLSLAKITATPASPAADIFYTFYGLIFGFIIAIPLTAAASRRLHDVGKSGWWQLISLTGVGLIPLTIWLARESDTNANKYGKSV